MLMLNFLTAIVDFFSAIGSFLLNIVEGIAFILQMIPQALGIVTLSYGYMPAALSVFAMAGISVCIIYFLIGR